MCVCYTLLVAIIICITFVKLRNCWRMLYSAVSLCTPDIVLYKSYLLLLLTYEHLVVICHFHTADPKWTNYIKNNQANTAKKKKKSLYMLAIQSTMIMLNQQNMRKARSHKWLLVMKLWPMLAVCTQLSKHVSVHNYYENYLECYTSFSKSWGPVKTSSAHN